MKQFVVFTSDPNLLAVLEFIRQYNLDHELHLNRTRFWVPYGPILTDFYLRFETFHVALDH